VGGWVGRHAPGGVCWSWGTCVLAGGLGTGGELFVQSARINTAPAPPPTREQPPLGSGGGVGAPPQGAAADGTGAGALPRPKAPGRVPKPGGGGGRTFTSRFRGVHQTFPTRRWEAQFRRAGRPTSLGGLGRRGARGRPKGAPAIGTGGGAGAAVYMRPRPERDAPLPSGPAAAPAPRPPR
jgi:hypothetical protein